VRRPLGARWASEYPELKGLGVVRLAQHSFAQARESPFNFCVPGPTNCISECFRRIRVEDTCRLGFFDLRFFERPLDQAKPIYRAVAEIAGNTL